jgi:plastocyanin
MIFKQHKYSCSQKKRLVPAAHKHVPHPLLQLVMMVFAALSITLLAACGSASPSAAGPTVSITNNEFTPKILYIQPGQTVTWINNGQSIHTVTADDQSFNSGNVQSGHQYRHTFTKAGRYPYYCQLHGAPGGVGMAGVVVVGNATSYGGTSGQTISTGSPPTAILHVPQQYPTIQAAVNAAKPYDMVLIAPGIYHEMVTIRTPHLTMRGQDRNEVILEGDFLRDDGIEVLANDVVVENMTARHFLGNGFYWANVTGYRGSYLTAYDNGDYGIYSYGSVEGQFDHDLASGQPDSGLYIGYCHPCHAVITDSISEDNALGYSGTNAGGDLVLKDSIWRDNMAGIVPNTLDSEPNPPEYDTTITNNLVEDNNNLNAPTLSLEYSSFGNGIVVAGGNDNHILNNRITGQRYYGISIVPNVDQHFWSPSGNVVENNVIINSGVADLGLSALSSANNCFSNNTVTRTAPPFLQFTHACGSLFAHAGAGDPSVAVVLLEHFAQANFGHYMKHDWKTIPAPVPATSMPDPNSNPQGIFTTTEGASFAMTTTPSFVLPGITIAGLGLASPFFEILTGFYLYYLPLALYAAWLSVATWDIVRRYDLKGGGRIGWMAIIYIIPVLGPIAYYFLGRSQISFGTRLALVIGAPLIYLAISVVLLYLVS